MKRFKKPKKNKEAPVNVSTHFIMSVVMPCVMLACKDVFKITDDEKGQAKLDKLSNTAQHYIDLIADGSVSGEQLRNLMTTHHKADAMKYLEKIVGGTTNEKCKK